MTDRRRAAVLRVLDRYLVEVVERHELCPWARTARTGAELVVDVLWGEPTDEHWAKAARAALASEGARIAMVVAPELTIAPVSFRALRDRVAAHVPELGVADFHPEAPLDLATPARLVPFVRRAPDPLLQVVPLAILDAVRGAAPPLDRAQQAQLLGGVARPSARDMAARIAAANHATVTQTHAAIIATLDDIARDRRASYAEVGIVSGSRGPR